MTEVNQVSQQRQKETTNGLKLVENVDTYGFVSRINFSVVTRTTSTNRK
jgi:hypothetical protein